MAADVSHYTLDTPIQQVRYIGTKVAKALQKRQIHTVNDLWNYLPYKYEDTTNIIAISKLYEIYQERAQLFNIRPELIATIIGIVEKTELIQSKRRKNFKLIRAIIVDQYNPAEKVVALWFNQIHVLHNLKRGAKVVLHGKFKKVASHLEVQNPQYEMFKVPLTHLGRITPVYERISNITSKMIRRYLEEVKPTAGQFREFIPQDILERFKLVDIQRAYLGIHFPRTTEDIKSAYTRLFVQELLELLKQKQREDLTHNPTLGADQIQQLRDIIDDLKSHLPFKLTQDQEQAIEQLLGDFLKHVRFFLYGDVGTGKTIVYLLLALGLAQLGYSSLLMAPTGILAEQHFNTLSTLLKKLPPIEVDPILITSRQRRAKRIKLIKPTVFIGTHALLYKEFDWDKYPPLLVGVDEEHKFGIFQRDYFIQLISELGITPYQLSLSATPIPRTLALTLYNYQRSVYIYQKPKGQKPISTHVVTADRLADMINWLKQHIQEGNQAFVVFPRIEGETIEEYPLLLWYDILTNDYGLSTVKNGILHGRMTEKQKNEVMESFRNGDIKLLFSTTIVEVGIDVPQATTMLIFGPELMGLAQLHQLRGRIGRNNKDAFCFLFSLNRNPNVLRRLHFFANTSDGMKIAEYDLKHRGPGDLLIGKEQHGFKRFKIANLSNYYLVNLALNLFNMLREKQIDIPPLITKSDASGR